MSDHDTDPMDNAYAQAEALLQDDDARATRRARVLAAVAAEPQAAPAPSRSAWRHGGWLVAASVASVSVFIAIQINRPPTFERPNAPPAPATSAAPSASMAPPTRNVGPAPPVAASPPAIEPSVQAPESMDRPRAAPSRGEAPAARAAEAIPPLPVPLAPPPPPPPPPSMERRIGAAPAQAPPRAEAPAASRSRIEEVVVTGSRLEGRSQDAPLAAFSRGSPGEQAEKLREAAAAGRTRELAVLLSRGVPIDATDDDGETALMKSIHADQLDATALLRRRGASLDLKNHAGRSARDMAAALADPELNKALGLER